MDMLYTSRSQLKHQVHHKPEAVYLVFPSLGGVKDRRNGFDGDWLPLMHARTNME